MSIVRSGLSGSALNRIVFSKGNECKFLLGYRLCAMLLCFSSLTVYQPVFSHEFQMVWDDWWVVMNDYTEGGFTLENVTAILTEFYHGQYAPVNEFYYLVLYSCFGYDPFWFHSAGLLIHVANVLLVFSLVKRLLRRRHEFDDSSVLLISFLTALLFSLHPLMVESVSWISASKCILYAFFYLLALHFYVSYVNSSKVPYFVATIFCFIFSFGSKEQAVTLPVCLLLFDYVMKQDIRSGKVWLEKLPFFLLAFVFTIITFFSQKHNGEGILSAQLLHPWYQNIAFAAYSITEYFIKCLMPLRLTYIYPFPNLASEPLPLQYWMYPLLLLFVSIGFFKFLKQRWHLFGIGFFLIQASVMCNLIPTSRFAIIADRYVYLAAVGLFFLMAYYINRIVVSQFRFKYLVTSIVALYFVYLGIYTYQRNKVWHNSVTLKKEMQETLKSRSDYKEWKKNYDLMLQKNQQ